MYYTLKDEQPASTEPVSLESEIYRRLNMAPVKHQLFGSGQGREREWGPLWNVQELWLASCSSSVTTENKREQKRSLSGSSVSDDSLAPTPVKVNLKKKTTRELHNSTWWKVSFHQTLLFVHAGFHVLYVGEILRQDYLFIIFCFYGIKYFRFRWQFLHQSSVKVD